MTATRAAALKLIITAATILTLLITGLGLAIYYSFIENPTPATNQTREQPRDVGRRDAIADAPMLQTTKADATAGTPALVPGPTMTAPPATHIGAVGIPSGFPHTPQGAAAQLGEILVSTLGGMNIAHATDVQQAWFQTPGDVESWPVMWLIQGFLEQARMPAGLDASGWVQVVPVAGQIKGTDGPDWVVACVLSEITYTQTATARLAYGHCERMAWTGTRWVIAPGSHPPPAPSTWPGTELAIEAGWRTWTEEA